MEIHQRRGIGSLAGCAQKFLLAGRCLDVHGGSSLD
jgi:hypothetical protein